MLTKTSNQYDLLMKEIKELNHEYKSITSSRKYQLLDVLDKVLRRQVDFVYIKRRYLNLLAEIKCKYNIKNVKNNDIPMQTYTPDYCFPKKIAVYTCMVQNYDRIHDPFIVPDNCDFYLYCDRDYKVNSSIWIKRDIDSVSEISEDLTPVEKNRFIKMCPHKLFPEYEYSFYIDANVKIMTDISEFMHNIGETGIAMHWHSRGCVYKEAQAVLYYHKASRSEVNQYIKFLREHGMPEDYGLVAGGTIARRHNDKLCIQIMEDWWDMFRIYIQRDQLLLPYILFKRGIDTREIASMPGERTESDAFLFFDHVK